MLYQFTEEFVQGKFIKRNNRFSCTVSVDERQYLSHVPNSGRMSELLVPGASVLLKDRRDRQRKTDFDLSLVEFQGHWVSVDSRLPNKLLKSLVRNDQLPRDSAAGGTSFVRREPAYGQGRFDLELMGPEGEKFLVELKSVTLVSEGRALFPDAPTERGRRHLQELSQVSANGYTPLVIFLVQRNDAKLFSPNWEMDPDFSKALQKAVSSGVKVESYAFTVTPQGLMDCQKLPVDLDN